MPQALLGLAMFVGGAVTAVANIVIPIAGHLVAIGGNLIQLGGGVVSQLLGAMGGFVSSVTSIIGGIVSGLGSTISGVLTPIVSTVGNIAKWVVTSIGQTVGSLAETVSRTVKPFLDGIGNAIKGIGKVFDAATRPILSPIKAGLQVIYKKVQEVGQWVTTAFHPSARLTELQAAHPEVWAVSDGSNIVFRDLLVSRGLIGATEGILLLMPDVLETINYVTTLKILADLTKGQASVADLLGAVADSKGFETAQAIALLSKGIITSTVSIMDRIDSEVDLLRAGIDSFDERLSRELLHYAHQTKAEILAMVTPRLDILGEHQLMVTRKIARLSRHIEDMPWFGWMLVRTLS